MFQCAVLLVKEAKLCPNTIYAMGSNKLQSYTMQFDERPSIVWPWKVICDFPDTLQCHKLKSEAVKL